MTPVPSLVAARAVTAAAFLDLFMQFPTVAPYAASLGASPAMVGLVVALYSATNLFGNVAGGIVLDRWGRRRPLLVGLLVTALAVAAYSAVSAAGALALLRAVHGLAASVLSVGAFAIMGDAAGAHRRAWVMGQGGALIGAAAVIGPPLAGILRDRAGFDAVFFTVATVMVLAAAAVWRWAPEVRPGGGGERGETAAGLEAAVRRLLGRRPLGAAYAAVFAYTVGLGVVVTHLPIMLERAGRSGAVTGMAFGLFALLAVVVMLSPATRASDRRGRRLPLLLGLAVIALALAAMGRGGAALIAGMGVFGVGFGLVFPSASALVAESVTHGERGRAFGVFYALWSLGTVAGAGLAGGIAQWQGAITGAPFLAAAPVALLGIPAVLTLVPRRPLEAPALTSIRSETKRTST